jgi:hypothetical protein
MELEDIREIVSAFGNHGAVSVQQKRLGGGHRPNVGQLAGFLLLDGLTQALFQHGKTRHGRFSTRMPQRLVLLNSWVIKSSAPEHHQCTGARNAPPGRAGRRAPG